MTLIKIPRGWELPESEATDRRHYVNRRQFIKGAGLGAIAAGMTACRVETITRFNNKDAGDASTLSSADASHDASYLGDVYDPADYGDLGQAFLDGIDDVPTSFKPAPRNLRYTVDHDLTPPDVVAQYNNYYEFTVAKDRVWQLVGDFKTRPWLIDVGGMVHNPKTYDIDDLLERMPSEERLYRHRCVEAWAMVVPWTGFPLKALLDEVQPMGSAKYVRFISYQNAATEPGITDYPGYSWPYFEALRLDEAYNDLTLVGTGLYGHPLPRQDGAPIRIILPWKYGFKSIKSIVKIELTEQQPPTFWHTAVPNEYGFEANVNPNKPHPRWSQAHERMIGSGEVRPTRIYNGYAEYVAGLYDG